MTGEVAFIDWPETYVAIVPRVAGTLSVISSSIIIFVIFRSVAQLSTIYHRIMFAMSMFDIIGSIGLALTFLPMPREMPLEKELGISWPGVRYGNTFTCNLQAFSIGFGAFTMLTYNASLCIYYACAIHYQLPENIIRKYVQPIIMTMPIISGLAVSIPPWLLDLYNPPTSLTSVWCVAIPYPDYEDISNDSLFLRGKKSDQKKFLDWTGYTLIFYFCVIVISLGLVIKTVCCLPKRTINIATGANSLPDGIICPDRDFNSENNASIAMPSSASSPLEGSHFKGKKLRRDSRHAPNEDVYIEVRSSTQINDGVAKHTESPMINMSIPPKRESNEMFHIANNSNSIQSENASFGVKRKKLRDGSQIATKENASCEKRQYYIGADRSSKSSIAGIRVPQKGADIDSEGPKSELAPSDIIGEEHIEESSILGVSGGEISMSDSTLEELQMIEKMSMNPGVLALQAFAYIASYGFLTALFCLIDPFDDGASTRLKIGTTIMPVQGLSNMLIFLSHKVYNYRRVHHETTIFQVLYLLFTTSAQEPLFVERMTVVHHHQAERMLNRLFRWSDEMGDRLLVIRPSAFVDEGEISEESPDDVVSSTYNRNRNGSGSSNSNLSGFSSVLSSGRGPLE